MSRSSLLGAGLIATLAISFAACAAAAPTPSPSAAPTTAPATTLPTASPSSEPTPASAGLPPDGTWQVELTEADLTDAGWPAEVTPSGTYTWTFEDGRATLDLEADNGSDAHCEADSSPIDDGFRLTYEPGECGGEVDDIRWELDDDGLHLILITTNAPLDQQKAYLETKPWQPAE